MQYLVHKVGAGEKAAQDLTYEEAREAAQLLLSGEATPAQAGGLLIAMRVKNETNEEMRAFTEVCRDYNKPLMLKRGVVPLDIPVYAGKKIFFHAIIPAAFLIAASGRPVLLHGFSGAPGRLGAADVLRSLGICVDFTPQEGSTILERQGFLYLDVAKFNPPSTVSNCCGPSSASGLSSTPSAGWSIRPIPAGTSSGSRIPLISRRPWRY
ncbi:MAG: hypothetical protein MPW13_05400 [Candidatus Manganitrophus sp.]|nr:hypothetical protein [Candidatus Manganitrophus sp.]